MHYFGRLVPAAGAGIADLSLPLCILLALNAAFAHCVQKHLSRVSGPFTNSVTRDAAFFDSDLHTPSARSLFLEFRRVTLCFTAARLLSVYYRLAARSSFAVRDCVTLESVLRFPPSTPR